jgi:hypothetical protein
MKKVAIIILCFFFLFPKISQAQASLPSYPEVIKEFFTNYSHERKEPDDRIFFVKKKEGWYVRIVNMLHNDTIKNEQLFRGIKENKYKPLNGFGPAMSDEDVAKKIAEGLRGGESFFVYGYERCRYFGYNEWDVDMIKDFGNSIPGNDTLLEGLARAYAVYAERYLAYGLGGRPYDDDPLKKKLGNSEIPGKERINQFMLYTNKGIDCYRALSERNPAYIMLVGTPGIKLLNEQFHQYQQLITYGYTSEAKQVLNTVKGDDIYRQVGHSYLDACPPNSILITNGDNDTYPLWFAQAKEGYRKDVTVLNYYLLGTVPYLHMLKKNKTVSFSTTSGFLEKMNPDYFYFYEEPGQPAEISVPLPTFIEDIQKLKHPYISLSDTMAAYATKTVLFDVDISRLKRICTQSNFVPMMNFELNDYILLSDFIILDILNKNLYTRPVCVTTQLSFFTKNHMQHEGSVYRILPLDENLPDSKTFIEITKLQHFLLKHYKPVVAPPDKSLNLQQDMLLGIQTDLFVELINGYMSLKDTAKAKVWAERYLAHPEMKKLPPDFRDIEMAITLLNTGHINAAKLRFEKLAEKLSDVYRNYSALQYYQTKDELLQALDYFKYMLGKKNITSDVLQKIIDDINK